MANGGSGLRPASRVVSEFADLAAKGAQVYPVLLQAGVTYWANWAGMALGYYGTLAGQWSRAVQEPERRVEHVQKMLDEFKFHLVSLAQLSGQAVLSSNQKIEALLREPADDPARADHPSRCWVGSSMTSIAWRGRPPAMRRSMGPD